MVWNKRAEWSWGYFLVAPTIIGLIILNIIPIFQSLYLSFFKSGDFGRGNVFVGLDNYRTLVFDPQVWMATSNTLLYTLLVVPTSMAIALLLAVWLNSGVAGKGFFRTIYFIPMAAAPAAVTMVWKWLYNREFGLINYILESTGFDAVDWIHNPRVALISVSIIGIWSLIGYAMVLFLAGLQEIPKDYYEAIDIDGGGGFVKFRYITLPLVSPTMFFIAVTSIIQSMQVFDVIYMMIGVTSPAYEHTVSLVYLFYNNSFKYSNKGYGSAIIILLLAIIMIITFLQVKLQKRWVNYRD
ncbi:sugar ABC transporter permease [Marispirochaeta sp.]|uniref:carbohydrate ABC transporter permease n=1 Tax=Marispirochaeta sp. TaxID=2038653 RepID=UPI0029C7B2AF|nr:sugar ABC transporter permease [Marispirochaeta sp.]